jgi:transcriptional regulator with XRE-family HTH domain
MNSLESTFAVRLRELMASKRITPTALAEQVGCSQTAISQMLTRSCRPQKATILKLAEVLDVQAQELWPDIEVIEMLDAVAKFQQTDYAMTEVEAKALSETSNHNRPIIPVKSLPKRLR